MNDANNTPKTTSARVGTIFLGRMWTTVLPAGMFLAIQPSG